MRPFHFSHLEDCVQRFVVSTSQRILVCLYYWRGCSRFFFHLLTPNGNKCMWNNRCNLLFFNHARNWNSFIEKKKRYSKFTWIFYVLNNSCNPWLPCFCIQFERGDECIEQFFLWKDELLGLLLFLCFFHWTFGAGKDEKEFWIQSYLFLCFSFLCLFFSSKFC